MRRYIIRTTTQERPNKIAKQKIMRIPPVWSKKLGSVSGAFLSFLIATPECYSKNVPYFAKNSALSSPLSSDWSLFSRSFKRSINIMESAADQRELAMAD